jgi:hypothetical protein
MKAQAPKVLARDLLDCPSESLSNSLVVIFEGMNPQEEIFLLA